MGHAEKKCGFISRIFQTSPMQQVETWSFVDSDFTTGASAKLKEKSLVYFEVGGTDQCGRWRAAKVTPAPRGQDMVDSAFGRSAYELVNSVGGAVSAAPVSAAPSTKAVATQAKAKPKASRKPLAKTEVRLCPIKGVVGELAAPVQTSEVKEEEDPNVEAKGAEESGDCKRETAPIDDYTADLASSKIIRKHAAAFFTMTEAEQIQHVEDLCCQIDTSAAEADIVSLGKCMVKTAAWLKPPQLIASAGDGMQKRLRASFLVGFLALDVDDEASCRRVRHGLEHAQQLVASFEKRASVDVTQAVGGKQWRRIKECVGSLPPTSGQAEPKQEARIKEQKVKIEVKEELSFDNDEGLRVARKLTRCSLQILGGRGTVCDVVGHIQADAKLSARASRAFASDAILRGYVGKIVQELCSDSGKRRKTPVDGHAVVWKLAVE